MSDELPKIKVSFIHPRNENGMFDAEVNSDCTGQMAIDGLLAGDAGGPFLEPTSPGRPYELVVARSSISVERSMTFQEAGIVDGDIIEIRQNVQGAGLNITEIAGILLSSGITLAALKGLIQIAVKLIENEGKKSVTIKLPDREVIIQGPGADERIKMLAEILSNHEGDFQITVTDKRPASSGQ